MTLGRGERLHRHAYIKLFLSVIQEQDQTKLCYYVSRVCFELAFYFSHVLLFESDSKVIRIGFISDLYICIFLRLPTHSMKLMLISFSKSSFMSTAVMWVI